MLKRTSVIKASSEREFTSHTGKRPRRLPSRDQDWEAQGVRNQETRKGMRPPDSRPGINTRVLEPEGGTFYFDGQDIKSNALV